jgi:hypothetical protein
MMFRSILLAAAAVTLSGCAAYGVQIHPRDGGSAATGTVDIRAKTMTVALNGKTFTGPYVHDGGQTVATSSFAQVGRLSGYSSGAAYVPGSGNGRVLLTSGSGEALRCEFLFRDHRGIGSCEDNAKRPYDLTIYRTQ